MKVWVLKSLKAVLNLLSENSQESVMGQIATTVYHLPFIITNNYFEEYSFYLLIIMITIKIKNNNNDNNNNDFMSVSSLLLPAKGLLIWDTIFTFLRWTVTFHMTATLKHRTTVPKELCRDGLISSSEKTQRSNHLQI